MSSGELGAMTKWEHLQPRIASHPAHRAVVDLGEGSTPAELFLDFLEVELGADPFGERAAGAGAGAGVANEREGSASGGACEKRGGELGGGSGGRRPAKMLRQ